MLCDLFEQKWVADERLRIEHFLIENSVDPSRDALHELILLEIDLLHARGLIPKESDYYTRFPKQSAAIQAGFHRIRRLEQSSVTTTRSGELCGTTLDWSTASRIPARLGDFRLVRQVGDGAFGLVYKARNVETQEIFALKFPRKQSLRSTDELQQLQNEAEAAAGLDHPAIVRSYGLRVVDGFVFNVQQFIEGTTLAVSKPVNTGDVVRLIVQIAEGLAHAHRHGLVHRDLKPSNVLIDRSGQPLIADFGLAIHEDTQRRLRGQRCGSPRYMSPEQVMGLTHQLDGRSDIWSLGVILYELLTKRRPFDGGTKEEIYEEIKSRHVRPLRMVRRELDREIQRICLKCLAKPVRERFNSADELSDDLRNWLKFEGQWDSINDVPLIPRGLRPYSAQDAEAYLQLLPGHRDRHGVPDNIQFWKHKLESSESSDGFTVGAIIGPSGCGKSSFVRAGLLPRLDPGFVKTIYVESTASNTETRLIRALRGLFPAIQTGLSLLEVFDGLRNRIWPNEAKNLLIVLDQFEQWLLENRCTDSSELMQALRHCDGRNLSCILILRDDFWLAGSRFLNQLGVGWSEDTNIQKLDLLEAAEAKKVLFKIGRALKCLPGSERALSSDQRQFLDLVVAELSNDGFVVCVHLSLCAEMFKEREWTVRELKKLGGISGAGETYLDHVFSRSDRPQPYITASEDAKRVLEALLPKPGINLRRHLCNENHLRSVVSDIDEHRFDCLISWLNNDVRLIARTGLNQAESGRKENADEPKHYQLAHDYLVPSLRNWLNQKKKETWKGRAELKLQDLSTQWAKRQETRFLPSLFDYLAMKLAVSMVRLRPTQVEYLSAATRLYVARFGIVMTAAFLVGVSFWGFHVVRMTNAEAADRLQRFLDCPPASAGEELHRLGRFSKLVRNVLPPASKLDQGRALRAAVAVNLLHGIDTEHTELIARLLGNAGAEEIRFVLSQLKEYPGPAIRQIRSQFEDTSDEMVRVKLGASLLYLGDTTPARTIFSNRRDPTEATLLTHIIESLFPDNQRIVDLVVEQGSELDPDLLFGLLIAASNYDFSAWSEPDQIKWSTYLANQFLGNSDSGIHGACRYLGSYWNLGLPDLPSSRRPRKGFDWWCVEVAPELRITFVRVPSGNFVRQQAVVDRLKEQFVPGSIAEVENEFWIAETETPWQLFRHWLRSARPAAADFSTKNQQKERTIESRMRSLSFTRALFELGNENRPVSGITFQEVQQLIAWTREQIGLPSEYYLTLPTADEFHQATRCKSNTHYYFGDRRVRDYLPRYAVVAVGGPDVTLDADLGAFPYSRIPNRFGLFDMNGNMAEFVRQTKRECQVSRPGVCFVVGGSLRNAEHCTTGFVNTAADNVMFQPNYGFRLMISKQND